MKIVSYTIMNLSFCFIKIFLGFFEGCMKFDNNAGIDFGNEYRIIRQNLS